MRLVPDAPAATLRLVPDEMPLNALGPGETPEEFILRRTPELVKQPRQPLNYQPSALATTALRVGAPLGAALATGGLGLPLALGLTAAAGGAGELAAQGLEVAGSERPSISLPQLGTATLLSGVPAAPLGRIASPLARGAIRVGEGAALGASAPVLEAGFRGELPEARDVGMGALFGGAVGAPFGAIEAARPAIPKSAQILAEPTTKSPSLANVATEVATNTKQNAFALQGKLNEMTSPAAVAGETIPPFKPSGEGIPATAQESASVFFPEIKEPAPVIKLAQESADVFEREAARASQVEARIQTLVDQLSGGDDVQRSRILARRKNLTPEQFLEALEGVAQFRRAPHLQPDALAADVEATARRPLIPGEDVENAGRIAPAELGAAAEARTLLSAEQAAAGFAGVTPEEVAARRIGQAMMNAGEPTPAARPHIAEAVAVPGVDFQYSVFKPGEGIKPFTQIDIIAPTGESLGSTNLDELAALGVKLPDVPEAMPQGQYMRAEVENFNKGGQDAIQIESPNAGVLRPEQPEVGLQKVGEGNAQPEVASRDQVREGAVSEPLDPRTEVEQLLASAPPFPAAGGRSPAATKQAARMRSTRGAIPAGVLAPLAGGGAGAAYGSTQGETPDERLRNILLYGSAGAAGGAVAGTVGRRALAPKVRQYQSPILKKAAQMLEAKATPKKTAGEIVTDAYHGARTALNTRFAPIGHAQRTLWKQFGRRFTPGAHYDLERGLERIAGAPVQAEGEVELLQKAIEKLPSGDRQHLDTYLTLSRIDDRLTKTSEENDVLMDAVGRAQADLDAYQAAFKAKPGERAAASVARARENLSAAKRKLAEEWDRKRVGDWSIADARKGLADLEAEIGPDAMNRIRQVGQEYQDVTRRALQIQVDSGRMSQDLMDRITAANDFYAPFKVLRHFEEEEAFVKGGGARRIPSMESLAKKITGIDDTDVRIGSPTATAAEQIYKGYILAQKNIALRKLATLMKLDPKGDFIAPLAQGVDPKQGFEKVGYFVNGEPKYMQVRRDMANALTGMDQTEMDIVLRGLAAGSQVFKLGATALNIPFNIVNAAVRDPIRLATISKYGFAGPQDFFWALFEWPQALFASARGNIGGALGMEPGKLYEQWMRSGAANSTMARALTPEAFASRLPKNLKPTEVVGEVNMGLGVPIKIGAILSNTLEETTKILGLKRAMRMERLDKLSPAERDRKWAEIVTEIRNYAGSPDFMRAGTSMRGLNVLLPFLNPRWQAAVNDFARLNPFRQGNAKDAALAWARMTGVIGIPAIGIALYNRSTPELEKDYSEIPSDEREKYFHFPLFSDGKGGYSMADTGSGGYYFKNKDGATIRGYYRVPKDGFPGLMANTIEDFVSYAKQTNPQTYGQMASEFLDRLGGVVSPVPISGDTATERMASATSALNPFIRLPIETGLNKNAFTGRDIVPKNKLDASPELQYTPSTPEAYKRAAEAIPDVAPEFLRSPARLQHITEGLTGGFTRQFVPSKLSEGNPAKDASSFLGRFFRSERVDLGDEQKAADEAIRGRADERIKNQEIAAKLAEAFQSLPTDDDRRALMDEAAKRGILDEATFEYFKEDVEDIRRGLTAVDRLVKRSYSVAGGFRARYMLKKLAELKSDDDRRAFVEDQIAKGLLTDEVAKQMGQIGQSATP